jgi:hypothetical protein
MGYEPDTESSLSEERIVDSYKDLTEGELLQQLSERLG